MPMRITLPLQKAVVLCEFEASDAEEACAMEFDPEVKRYLRLPNKSPSEWIESFKSQIGSLPSFAVVTLPERILAGRASIGAPVLGGNVSELEIVIAKPFWGDRLGRAVADLLIREAFCALGASTVTATVHPENAPSLRLLRAFQFEEVGLEESGWQSGHLKFALHRGA